MRTKRHDPKLPGEADLAPRLGRGFRREERLLLSSLRAARSEPRTRSNRSNGGRGRIRVPKLLNQRVLVKARVVKMEDKKGIKNLRSHLHYLTRSGVGLDGKTPQFILSDRELSRTELSKTLGPWQGDPHLFRFIISPELGTKLDLPTYTRDLVAGMERDLKTKLEWFAVPHYNTDNPHVHLVVRGVDDSGKPLIISRDYIKHGMRHLAEHEATRHLGKRPASDLQVGRHRDLQALRMTYLDKVLLREQACSLTQTVRVGALALHAREWERQAREDKVSRLSFLTAHGLALEIGTGEWKISDDAERTLRQLSRRAEVQKLIEPHLSGPVGRQALVMYDREAPFKTPVVGEVIAKEVFDDLHDRRFVLVSGSDGRNHFVELSRFSEPKGFSIKAGAIVELAPARRNRTDEVIARHAGEHGGRFDLDAFAQYVRERSEKGKWRIPEELTFEDYLARFTTRAETLASAGILSATAPRSWSVPVDMLDQVDALNQKLGKAHHVGLIAKSHHDLSGQVRAPGATWLDTLLEHRELIPSPKTVFGAAINAAIGEREEQLRSQGIAIEKGLAANLREREVRELARSLVPSLGEFKAFPKSKTFTGSVHGYRLLSDGYYAVVKREGGFSVVKAREAQGRLDRGVTVEITATRHRKAGGFGEVEARMRLVSRAGERHDLGRGKGR